MNFDTNDMHILNAVKRSLVERGKLDDAANVDTAMDSVRSPVGLESRKSIRQSSFSEKAKMLEILDLMEGKGYINPFVGHGIITHNRITSFAADQDFVAAQTALFRE